MNYQLNHRDAGVAINYYKSILEQHEVDTSNGCTIFVPLANIANPLVNRSYDHAIHRMETIMVFNAMA